MGCNTVIITLGAEGAIFGSKNTEIIHVPAMKAEKVVDTTVSVDIIVSRIFSLFSSNIFTGCW